jgi:catechol 2,3-dioxygenase-like lactoylglutathione lyase family enzyme
VDRFDHAVIAVRDLDAAMSAYGALGFEVNPGGRHTGRGTHNAIIRFGLDYIELLAIYDEGEERAHGGELSSFFSRNPGGGLVAFAVATSHIDDLAAAWSSAVAPAGPPEPMERVRPDGFRLSWRLFIPGGSPWGKPWPFVIQWDTPDSERLAVDVPGRHANGAAGIAGVTVATDSVDAVTHLYADGLGLPVESRAGEDVVLKLGECLIRLTRGDAERPVAVELRTAGGTRTLEVPPA